MEISRRKFTQFVGSTLAGAALMPASAYSLSDLGAKETAWQELIDALGGQVYQYNDKDYVLRARVNNLRYMRKLPQAVAIIDTPERAKIAIKWCAENRDVEFCIKGGGHSYAGFSTCSGLVLSTQGMNEITLLEEGLIKVGAGALNYAVYDELAEYNRSITHGRCPTVGVAGFVLGGGIGFDMRNYGLACDHLSEAEIVTVNGEVITANANENADMFWALRGGAGGNLGLCTSVTFETFDVAKTHVYAFERKYRGSARNKIARLLNLIMSLCQESANQLGTRISVQYLHDKGVDKKPHFQIDFLGQWVGEDKTQINNILANAENLADQYDISTEVALDYHGGAGEYWDAQHTLEEPEELYYYQERSTFIPTTPDIDAIEFAFAKLSQRPDVRGPCDLRFFQTGGAINRVPSDHTAFVHRSSQWIALVGYYWEGGDDLNAGLIAAGHQWQDEFYENILLGQSSAFQGAGAYQNFPDVSLLDSSHAYYGSNLEKLREIKAKYDPDKLFDFAQAILPA